MAVEVEYWPTFDATLMIGHGSREQILQAYRHVRDQLFTRSSSVSASRAARASERLQPSTE